MAIKPLQKNKSGGNGQKFGGGKGASMQQMAAYMTLMMQAKGKAKGGGKGFMGKGKSMPFIKGKGFMGGGKGFMGKGRGMPVIKGTTVVKDKFKEKLSTIDASLKVWIGGLADKTTWKDVEKHFAAVAKPAVTDLMRKGTACVAYKNVDDVANAIAMLNGSELGGNTIEVDVWTKPPKREKAAGDEGAKKTKKKKKKGANANAVMQTLFTKPEKQPLSKVAEKLKGIDPSFKVWIGGLSEDTTWQDVRKHFTDVGKIDATDLLKKGKAVVAFKDAADVSTAISMLNGSELKGQIIEVDVWTKPEKKVKA